MAAITSVSASGVIGAFACNEQTLSSSDTITIAPASKQLMVVRNATGSPVNLLVDGDGGTSVSIKGLGAVSVSGGLTIAIPAGESRAVVLSTISYYTQGVVTLSGASGARIQIFNL
jgi:hypothetical protein